MAVSRWDEMVDSLIDEADSLPSCTSSAMLRRGRDGGRREGRREEREGGRREGETGRRMSPGLVHVTSHFEGGHCDGKVVVVEEEEVVVLMLTWYGVMPHRRQALVISPLAP